MYKALWIYFLIINLIGAILNISDKQRAKKDRWRIAERRLWLVALLGGAPLSYLTMQCIRHKTKHTGFMLGMPVLAILQILLFIWLKSKGGI